MKHTGWHVLVLIFTLFVIGAAEVKAVEDMQPLELLDFGKGFDIRTVQTENAGVMLSDKESLLMRAGKDQRPNITLNAPDEHWTFAMREGRQLRSAAGLTITSGSMEACVCLVEKPGRLVFF